MSSIKNINISNSVPLDLAKKLGNNGIGIILSIMWLGYHDLKNNGTIYSTMDEDSITVEWYTKIYDRWTSENRAAQINMRLIPINQYPDNTTKVRGTPGKAPTIDFCFRAWDKSDGYFGAECKRLSIDQSKLLQEYVVNGVNRFTSGKYASKCSVSAMIGYVQNGKISDVVSALELLMKNANLKENLVRILHEPNPEYKTVHIRDTDSESIVLHHLFFDFTPAA